MSFLDFAIAGVIVLLAVLSVILMKKRKKEGRCCSGNCSSCNRCK